MQGLDWILRMYSEGSCPNYRWTYDAYGPSAGQLAAELSSKQQEGEAEQVSAYIANSEPLLACLVDLLTSATLLCNTRRSRTLCASAMHAHYCNKQQLAMVTDLENLAFYTKCIQNVRQACESCLKMSCVMRAHL